MENKLINFIEKSDLSYQARTYLPSQRPLRQPYGQSCNLFFNRPNNRSERNDRMNRYAIVFCLPSTLECKINTRMIDLKLFYGFHVYWYGKVPNILTCCTDHSVELKIKRIFTKIRKRSRDAHTKLTRRHLLRGKRSKDKGPDDHSQIHHQI